jgi:hypothetical protein
MSVKKVLEEINIIQLQNFCSLNEFRTNKNLGKGRGIYWIWTNLDFEKLEKLETAHKGEVPIGKLIAERKELNNICKLTHNNFKVVYNGIGGYLGTDKKEKYSYDLRGRINQEICSNNPKTGTLNLSNRKNHEIENWAVSYFNFDNYEDLLKNLGNPQNSKSIYAEFANMLEMNWRIQFGHPILNRH